jgi:hypothetical protein
MKILITESQYNNIVSSLNEIIFFGDRKYRSFGEDFRYKFIAKSIIEYMDKMGITTIPTYNTLSDDVIYKIDISKFEPWGRQRPHMSWKKFLGDFLNPKELDTIIKPMIAQMRPEYKDFSSFSKTGAKNHVIDGLRLASLGEVIVYNTFKMNGIILDHEPKDQKFKYTYVGSDGVTITKNKIPDFYWREKNIMIEVAGLTDDGTIAKGYSKRINAAKEEMDRQNREYIILDYYSDRNNKPKFYKLVCETFNFDYNPNNYSKSISGYKGIDRSYCEKEVERILRKPVKDTTGAERERVAVMMKDCLSRTINTPEGTDEVGYDSKWTLRRDMGIGKRVDPKVRDKVQQAWCESPYVSAKGTSKTYTEIFNEKISHSTIEIIMNNNKEMFDKNNKENICNK